MEDDKGPKFTKSIAKEKLYEWKARDFLSFVQVPSQVIKDAIPDPVLDYYPLIYDSEGVPSLPAWETHPSIYKWRKTMGEFFRYYWGMFVNIVCSIHTDQAIIPCTGKMKGSKLPIKPDWTTIAEDVYKYINAEFLPPQDVLSIDDLVMKKPATMDKEQLMLWILHLLSRQEMVKRGELTTVFEFKKCLPKALRAASGVSPAIDSDEEEQEIEVVLKAFQSAKRARAAEADDSGSSSSGATTTPPHSDDEDSSSSSSTPNPSPVDEEESESEVERIEPESPASAGKSWTSRIQFLRSLSGDVKYLKLVQLLAERQVGLTLDPYKSSADCLAGSLPTCLTCYRPCCDPMGNLGVQRALVARGYSSYIFWPRACGSIFEPLDHEYRNGCFFAEHRPGTLAPHHRAPTS